MNCWLIPDNSSLITSCEWNKHLSSKREKAGGKCMNDFFFIEGFFFFQAAETGNILVKEQI